MKRVFAVFLSFFIGLSTFLTSSAPVRAEDATGLFPGITGALSALTSGYSIAPGEEPADPFLRDCSRDMQNMYRYFLYCKRDASGGAYSPGILGTQGKIVATLFDNQISSKEYVADLLDNIGVPSVSRAYAQGTGYSAMTSFLPFWKVFRNLAYSLYIIMFVVVGIMIMLRTKVNAQTIITIQSALPNLIITLILITFSYAIVGFMIDLMYFLIYLVVYLIASAGIITDPTKVITRFMSSSAWSVVFSGRNSIISAVSSSIGSVLWGLGTGGIGVAGALISMVSPMYLIVAIAFAIAMLKLMVALIKSYVMVIVQTVTAPVQILMNAVPGSKSFSTWLKTTASYLIPFPVAAAMFIFSAILVGNPTDKTLLNDLGGDANPFGVNQGAEIYQNRENIWLPPFTLTDASVTNADVLTLIGFFIFLMTPTAVKMAQDWLQVKESPYTADAFSNLTQGIGWGTMPGKWFINKQQEEIQMQRQAALFRGEKTGMLGSEPKNAYKKG